MLWYDTAKATSESINSERKLENETKLDLLDRVATFHILSKTHLSQPDDASWIRHETLPLNQVSPVD